MKRTIILIPALAVLAGAALQAPAQWTVPPPASTVALRSSAELDQLLAPIALYPDPLVAQILPAATQPAEVVLAARYVFGGGDMGQLDFQPWSPSVKAVARYSDVLKMMDQRLDWTTQLGQAFLLQQADVMTSIQRLRLQAQALGNLHATPQQRIVVNSGVIEILPANPEVIYVPVYQPDLVFMRRGIFLAFGVGFSIGFWLDHDCDWHHHNILVWHRDHFRPHDWWRRPPRERVVPVAVNNRVTLVNRDVTVWQPHVRASVATVHPPERKAEPHAIRSAPVAGIHPAVKPPEPRHETGRAVLQRPAPEKRPLDTPKSGGGAIREDRHGGSHAQPRRETTIQPAPSPRPAAPTPPSRELRPGPSPSQPKREATIQPAPRAPRVAPAPSVRKPEIQDPAVAAVSPGGPAPADRPGRRSR
jgi:hypothetical protein